MSIFRSSGHRQQGLPLYLTSYSEDSYVKEALSLNVDSYILKENSSTELLASLDSLTPRERELIRLVAEARTGKKICSSLGISESTMKGHEASIMRKLGLHSSAEILLYARRNNLVMD